MLHWFKRKPDLSAAARELARVRRVRRAIIDELHVMQGKPAWKWGPL